MGRDSPKPAHRRGRTTGHKSRPPAPLPNIAFREDLKRINLPQGFLLFILFQQSNVHREETADVTGALEALFYSLRTASVLTNSLLF